MNSRRTFFVVLKIALLICGCHDGESSAGDMNQDAAVDMGSVDAPSTSDAAQMDAAQVDAASSDGSAVEDGSSAMADGGAADAATASGRLSFGAPLNYSVLVGGTRLITPDFNGDGFSDIAIVTDEGVALYLAHGDGTMVIQDPLLSGIWSVAVTDGDFDGNGSVDLVVATADPSRLSLLLGNGDGSFLPATNLGDSTVVNMLASGDLYPDGKLDFVSVDQTSTVLFYEDASGHFYPPLPYRDGSRPREIVTGDFTGDGLVDLAAANVTSGAQTLDIRENLGGGNFGMAKSTDLGGDPNGLVAADFDQDGKLDLAIGLARKASIPPSILLLHGNGDGSFQKKSIDIQYSPLRLATGDFDGDGWLDLAVSESSANGGVVQILLNDGTGELMDPVTVYSSLFAWAVASGDFNGDGKPDLAILDSPQTPLPLKGTLNILVNTHR